MTVADLLKLARPYAEQRSADMGEQDRILGQIMAFVGYVDEVANETPEARKRRLARERQKRRRNGAVSRSCHAESTSTGKSVSRSVTLDGFQGTKMPYTPPDVPELEPSHVTLCHAGGGEPGKDVSRSCHAGADSEPPAEIPPFSPKNPSTPLYIPPKETPNASHKPLTDPEPDPAPAKKAKKKAQRPKVEGGGYHLWTVAEFAQRAEYANQQRGKKPGQLPPLPPEQLALFIEFWCAPTKTGHARFSDCDSWAMGLRLGTWYKRAVDRGEIRPQGASTDMPDDLFR